MKKLIDQKVINRFWNKVNKTNSCWLFKNGIKRQDYGTFGFRGKIRKAHRVSWIIHFGEIPLNLCVCHTCDNPPCVNPEHLFLGSRKDNIHDALNKGRLFKPPSETLPRGVDKTNAKLNDDKVREIRLKYIKGSTYRQLSMEYGVEKRTIGHIIHRRKWKHVN